MPEQNLPDCRCAICDCCTHDHSGWNHEWTPKVVPDAPPECDHLLTYVTPMSGLEGLYWRCRECGEYWRMNPYEDFAAFPQRHVLGFDPGTEPAAVYVNEGEGWQHLGYTTADGVGAGLEDEPDDWTTDDYGNVVDLR